MGPLPRPRYYIAQKKLRKKYIHNISTILGHNAFTTGNPFWAEKSLGISMERGLGALEGLRSPVIFSKYYSQKVIPRVSTLPRAQPVINININSAGHRSMRKLTRWTSPRPSKGNCITKKYCNNNNLFFFDDFGLRSPAIFRKYCRQNVMPRVLPLPTATATAHH